MTFPQLCTAAPVALDIPTATENDAITATAGLLTGWPDIVDTAGFLSAVLERQQINPPLLGNGIALPHARTPLVREVVMAILRTREPVPFGPQGSPVRLIFLYGIPPHHVSEHLATTAALARRLRDADRVRALLETTDADSFRQLLL
ncbi:MAG: PTS sugar transporter subunit IIA [Verrucomicrobiaceae bacterium]|nr:MAG: PTS sugar transporter subunit IIA [Verrucomicrobiaceae bacterium]